MANSVSGQDLSNPALWLVTRAGEMVPSCPREFNRYVTQETSLFPYNKPFIDQACSVKMAGYWVRFSGGVYGPWLRLGLMNTQEKYLGQYLAILTSRLVMQ